MKSNRANQESIGKNKYDKLTRMSGHASKKAWVVSVNMGYGHERAAFGLEDLAYGDIVTANNYPGIPEKEKKRWDGTRKIYEIVSRLQPIPGIGQAAFNFMDMFQRIPDFYPQRDLSRPSLQLRQIYRMIRKQKLGKHLVEKLAKHRLPLISTFFIPAFAAEEHGYPGDIYLVTCDADVSRAWAPLDPKKSRIKYFAANGRVVERLKLYGVREENIFLTGFPLPKPSIGGPEATIVKKDLAARICNLDPNGIFINKYTDVLKQNLGEPLCNFKKTHPLTVTFSVGGAGAQHQLAIDLSVKQATPDLLQKLLKRPVLQFAFFRLTDEQTPVRKISERRQTQFIGMREMSHINGSNDLALRMRNRSRQFGEPELFANDAPNDAAFDKICRRIRTRQRSSQLLNSGNSIDP